MSRRTVTELDLRVEEQEHVRNALYFLRAKFGTWRSIARLLHFEEATLVQCANGTRPVAANMAFRLARVIALKVDDLLAGKFPEPGVCPRCAYRVPLDGSYRERTLARDTVRRSPV